jgi:hypothetical protein
MYPVHKLYDQKYTYEGFKNPLIPLQDYLHQYKNNMMANEENIIIGASRVKVEPIIIGTKNKKINNNWKLTSDNENNLLYEEKLGTQYNVRTQSVRYHPLVIKDEDIYSKKYQERLSDKMANSEYTSITKRGCGCLSNKMANSEYTSITKRGCGCSSNKMSNKLPTLKYDEKLKKLVVVTL